MFSKLKFLINYLKILLKLVEPFKKHYFFLIFLIFINALIEAVITYGVIIVSSSYLDLNNYFSEILSNLVLFFDFVTEQSQINKDYIIIYSLFFSLILRQTSLGINQTYMHYLNTKVTAHVRFKVTKGYIENNKKELENYISGSIEQILSQDSKFTAQSFYFFIQCSSMFFYILFSIILLYLISFNLLILLLIFTVLIVPLKILYSKIILISSSTSKKLEYKMMSNISDIQNFILKNNLIKNNNILNKFKKYVTNSSKSEAYYRILMVWEAFFIQILSLLLIILLIFFERYTSSYNLVQLIAFSFVLFRTIPFITKASKFFNSFMSRHELVMRTIKLYENKYN